MAKAPIILLINPWITDFAAYDMWAKPMGLMQLAALLRDGGLGVAFIDCMDRHEVSRSGNRGVYAGKMRRFGTGKFPKAPIEKPAVYGDFPRTYYRYGIHPDSLFEQLNDLPSPDLIWVTGIMTYWYPGIRMVIRSVKQIFPDVPVWLGGIYGKLCTEHAIRNSGADEVFVGRVSELPKKIEAATGFRPKNRSVWNSFALYPEPAWDLLRELDYVPLMISRGCPFHCPYCASHELHPDPGQRSGSSVYSEVRRWHRERGIVDFAFYDDALLLNGGAALREMLDRIRRDGLRLRFHTPNALHIRALSSSWCELFREAGFTTVRLGLETTRPDRQLQWGGKVDMKMFETAVGNLVAAGFEISQLGAYLLCGLPEQTPDEVAEAMDLVGELGVQPYLAEYSPIPGTVMWQQAKEISEFDIDAEPLYQNNTFFACRRPDFTYQDLERLKRRAREVRRRNAGA